MAGGCEAEGKLTNETPKAAPGCFSWRCSPQDPNFRRLSQMGFRGEAACRTKVSGSSSSRPFVVDKRRTTMTFGQEGGRLPCIAERVALPPIFNGWRVGWVARHWLRSHRQNYSEGFAAPFVGKGNLALLGRLLVGGAVQSRCSLPARRMDMTTTATTSGTTTPSSLEPRTCASLCALHLAAGSPVDSQATNETPIG